MNEKLIKQLREGTIALMTNPQGVLNYYYKRPYHDEWIGIDYTHLPSHSVKEFLKPENEYPKVMKVSRFPINTKEDFKNASTRVVFMEKRNRFLAWHNSRTLEQSKNETKVFTWNYAVDLDWQPEEETKPLKLTMEQIAQKFNAEKIEIVN